MIRSHNDAYELATALDNTLAEGESVNINFIIIRKENDRLYATGQIHRHGEGEQKYVPCEFADFVIWPERKRFNDAIRNEANKVYFERLRNWPNI
jgi:hypothetical protein